MGAAWCPRRTYVVINQLFLSPPAVGPRPRYGPDRLCAAALVLVVLSCAGTAGPVVLVPRTLEVAESLSNFENVSLSHDCHEDSAT